MLYFLSGYLKEEFQATPPPDFLELYDRCAKVVWAFDERVYQMQDELRLGADISPRRCCFCGRTGGAGATFKSVSHAVPESLGNKRVISREECDDCNNKFSSYEEQLARMLSVERVFGGARGKGGIASFGEAKEVSARRGPHGVEVTLKVDTQGGALRETGDNALELKLETVECKPALAIRSLLRTAWMTLSPSQRERAPEIHSVAVENPEKPLEFLSLFSPGLPTAAGYVRVHLRKVGAPTSWPPAVVSLSLLNTTLVWRAPNNDGYVIGPLPPLEADEQHAVRATKYRVEASDARLSSASSFGITYSKKLDALSPAAAEDPLAEPHRHPAEQLKEGTAVSIAVGTEADHTEWISAIRQVKRISGDFTYLSSVTIFSQDHGVRLGVSRKERHGPSEVAFNFDGKGVRVSAALRSISFVRRFGSASDGEFLFIREGDDVGKLPLGAHQEREDVAKRYVALEKELGLLAQMGAVLGVDITAPAAVPTTDREVLQTVALAITGGKPVRVRQTTAVELALPKEEFERHLAQTGKSTIFLDCVSINFPEIPELTADVIGPVLLYAELERTADQCRAAVTSKDDTVVHCRFQLEALLYVFEKHVRATEATPGAQT